jgi:hypothetical protein
VSDLFAFVLRRYAELSEYGAEPVYPGEKEDIDPLVELLAPRLIARTYRCPKRSKDECAAAFVNLTPRCLIDF